MSGISNTSSSSPIQTTINLDRFQNQIESKLRQPFTSVDLTKSILTTIASSSISSADSQTTNSSTHHPRQHQQQQNHRPNHSTKHSNISTITQEEIPSSNEEYIHCLSQIFPRLMKPIKLRLLISLLGFIRYIDDHSFSKNRGNVEVEDLNRTTSSTGSLINEMELFLKGALESTTKQDKWIKVMCHILQSKLQIIQEQRQQQQQQHDKSSTSTANTATNHSENNTNNNTPIIDSTIKKGIDKIISSITSNAQHAFDLRQEAEVKFMPADPLNNSSQNLNMDSTMEEFQAKKKKMEIYIDSFQIGTDVQPYYTPYYYKLCSMKKFSGDGGGDGSSSSSYSNSNHSGGCGGIYSELNDRCDFTLSPSAEAILNPNNNSNSIHNAISGKCHILQMDEINDRKRAEEEAKEMEAKRIANERKQNTIVNMKMKNSSSTTTANHNKMTQRSNSTTNNTATISKKNGIDTASLMMRGTKMKGGAGVGGLPTSNGTNGQHQKILRNPVTGKVRKAGFGRGAAANSIGGKSLTIPGSRSNMAARALLRTRKKTPSMGTNSGMMMMKKSNGSIGGGVTTGKLGSSGVGGVGNTLLSSKGGAAMRNKTKMKMIDVNEVKGLKKDDEERQAKLIEEETKESRKRKMAGKGSVMKRRLGEHGKATSSSLEKNEAISDEMKKDHGPSNDQGANKRAKIGEHNGMLEESDAHMNLQQQEQLQQQQINNNIQQQQMNLMMNNNNGIPMQTNMDSNAYQTYNTPIPHFQNNDTQAANQLMTMQGMTNGMTQQEIERQNQNSWQQLLEKSNKLSDEDRYRVTQFFTTRVNPTPEMSVFKTKLHEEKLIDPVTQQPVKETYYIELDYNTFEFKKLRKKKTY